MKTPRIPLALCPLLALAAVFPAVAGGPTVRYVANGGSNTTQCTDPENPCASIHHALSWADSGDIIDIAAGQYSTGLNDSYFIQTDITFQGAGRGSTFLQAHADPGQANRRVIEIAPLGLVVTISDLTIRHGLAEGSGESGRGGGIYNPDGAGELYLSNVDFVSNTARVGGGLLNINGGVVQLQDVGFAGNEATQRGGGIYNAAGTAINLSGVNLVANGAGISGGGIYNEGGVSPALDSVDFNNNQASENCAGMCLQNTATAPTIVDTQFIGNTSGHSGGGLYLRNSSPELTRVTFSVNKAAEGMNNTTHGGGGMYLIENSDPVLTEVTFHANRAAVGGGMHNRDNSNPALTGVTFTDNQAKHYGGGMKNESSNPTLTHVTFSGNTALEFGLGGALQNGSSSPTLKNVTFVDNNAVNGYGGAVHNQDSNPTFINVSMIGNQAGSSGGGMYNLLGSAPAGWNVSLSGNSANDSGGGIYNISNSAPILYNTILWNNIAGNDGNEVYNASDGFASLHYSLHADGSGDIHDESGSNFTCSDCVTEDPLFVNAAAGNLRLSEGSPAIDAGNPGTPIGIFPGNPGNPVDLDGNPRFHNAIDMGAYEWFLDEIFRDRFEQ